ncbi:MAG: hypothetical protein ACN4GF_08700 [Lentimonas sp.]
MKNICKWIGLLSIAVTFILPIVFFIDRISLDAMKQGMLISTLVWFATSLFWIGGKVSNKPDGDPIL